MSRTTMTVRLSAALSYFVAANVGEGGTMVVSATTMTAIMT